MPRRTAPTLDPTTIPVDWFTRRIMNPVIATLIRAGIPLGGANLLTVVGRRSGARRTAVVNVLELDDQRYLIAPRGQTEWVRNLRSTPNAELRRGRRRHPVVAAELDPIADADADADEMLNALRAYLRRWGWQVSAMVDGARHDDPDDRLRELVGRLPMFRLTP